MPDRASSTITIDAEPAAVMSVIADFPAYPDWVNFIKRAEVVDRAEDGRGRQVRFVLDAGLVKDDYVLAYEWDDDTRVSWRLVSGRAMKAQDGTYALTRLAPGRTEVRYELAVELQMQVPGMVKRTAERVIVDTALKGLKKRVESG